LHSLLKSQILSELVDIKECVRRALYSCSDKWSTDMTLLSYWRSAIEVHEWESFMINAKSHFRNRTYERINGVTSFELEGMEHRL
jgi:hypothetical protein